VGAIKSSQSWFRAPAKNHQRTTITMKKKETKTAAKGSKKTLKGSTKLANAKLMIRTGP